MSRLDLAPPARIGEALPANLRCGKPGVTKSMAPDLNTPYRQLGGEDSIRKLVHRFYALMDTLPEAWDVRQMHPEDLSRSEEKLFKYLSGWLAARRSTSRSSATRACGRATCPSASPAPSATSG